MGGECFFWVILKTINSLLSLKFPLNIPVDSLTPLYSSKYIRIDPFNPFQLGIKQRKVTPASSIIMYSDRYKSCIIQVCVIGSPVFYPMGGRLRASPPRSNNVRVCTHKAETSKSGER